jgi:hypothetical protein
MFAPPVPWDVFSAYFLVTTNMDKVFIRWTQATTTNTFRIDDISIGQVHPLSVKLHEFNGVPHAGRNMLSWKATSTDDKELFIVEKSKNAREFTEMKRLHAKGAGEYSYECTDDAEGRTFYRLKLVDGSGRYAYSKIVTLSAFVAEGRLVQSLFPLPATDALYIRLNSPAKQEISLSISDLNGAQVAKQMVSANEGTHNYKVGIEALSQGLYNLTVTGAGETHTEKIMVTGH